MMIGVGISLTKIYNLVLLIYLLIFIVKVLMPSFM